MAFLNPKIFTLLLLLSFKCISQQYINLTPFASTAICEGSEIPVYFTSNLTAGTVFTAQLKKNGEVLYGRSSTTSPIYIPFTNTSFIQASVEVVANGNLKSQESDLLSLGKPNIYLTDNIRNYNSSNFIQLCQGTSKILEVRISDFSREVVFNNPISYQWKKDNIVIPNATSPTFEISETGNYRCDVVNQNCTYIGATVRVFFTPPQGFNGYLDNLDSGGQDFECIGKSKTLKVFYNSQNTSYQWFRNDSLIQTTNTREFNIDKSGRYSVKIFDKTCTINSEYKKITFSSGLSTPMTPTFKDTVLCNFYLVSLLATSDFNNLYNYYGYSWQKEKVDIFNILNNRKENLSGLSVRNPGNFRVIYNRGDCFSGSKEINVISQNIGQKPTITIRNGFETCNKSVLIQSESGYVDWYKNGIKVSNQYPEYLANTSGTYKAVKFGGNCLAESNEIILDFENRINKPKLIVENEKYTLCSPNDFTRIIFDVSNIASTNNLNTRLFRNNTYLKDIYKSNIRDEAIVTINQAGNYYVEVYEGDCFTRSNTIEIIERQPIIKIINETDITSCSNSLVKFRLKGILNDDLGKVKWFKDNIEIPYEYDNSIYQNKAGIYKATYQNNSCLATSENFNLNVLDVPNRPDSSIHKINIKDEVSLTASGCIGNVSWYNSNYDLNSFANGNTLLVDNLISDKSYFISCEKDGCQSLLRSEIKVNVCSTNTTINTGNFNDPSIWSCGLVPNKYSNVIISAGNRITIDGKFSIKSLVNNGEIEINNNGEIEIFQE